MGYGNLQQTQNHFNGLYILLRHIHSTIIWIHAIWAIKARTPLIDQKIEQKLFQFISEQLREQCCLVRIINSTPNHVHCLFLLNPQKSISIIIKQIKGSSSHFVNQNNLTAEKFAWQTGYASYSISETIVEKVYQYIKKRKQHHQKNILAGE